MKVRIKSLTKYNLGPIHAEFVAINKPFCIEIGSVYEVRYIPALDPNQPELGQDCVVLFGYYVHPDDYEVVEE